MSTGSKDRPHLDGPGTAPPGAHDAYRAVIERLYALSRSGTHLGLGPTARVLADLGHPELAYPSVHVAGSNGKGSTSAFLAAILAADGQRVGLYTSPHLVSLTERVQFLMQDILPEELTPDELVRVVGIVELVAPGFSELSFFEVVTAAGLVALRDRGVDVAVIEAGLGARLDATRLVDARVSVLTDLSLEHTDILGETIEEIAAEEGAVMRPGRPLVMADGPPAAMRVVDRMAREANVEVHRLGVHMKHVAHSDLSFDFDLGDRQLERVQLALLGAHQGRNALLAAKAATLFRPEVSDDSLRRGLEGARWPGRMETFRRPGQPPVVLDGAHNAQGAEALAAALVADRARFAGPFSLVFGVLADKDVRSMLEALAPLAGAITLTRPGSARAVAPEELRGALPEGIRAPVQVVESTTEAFEAGIEEARRLGGWVVVCGSLYLVGDARAWLLSPSVRP